MNDLVNMVHRYGKILSYDEEEVEKRKEEIACINAFMEHYKNQMIQKMKDNNQVISPDTIAWERQQPYSLREGKRLRSPHVRTIYGYCLFKLERIRKRLTNRL